MVKIKHEFSFRSIPSKPLALQTGGGRNVLKRFALCARPGPEKAGLLESLFTFLGVFGIMLSAISCHWERFRSVGAVFFSVKKWIGPPNEPHEAPPENTFTFWDRFGSRFLNVFDFSGHVLNIVCC